MGLAKPTGEYVDRILSPGGWPEADEDQFYERAEQFAGALEHLNEALETCLRQRSEIFEGGLWSGGAAGAADAEFQTRIDAMVTLQNGLRTAIDWHRYVAASIAQAKSDICDNLDSANRQIDALAEDSELEDSERTEAIEGVVIAAHRANTLLLQETAEQILASRSRQPQRPDLPPSGDRKPPPPISLPDTPADPGDDDDHRHRPPKPAPEPRPSPTPPTPGPPPSPAPTPITPTPITPTPVTPSPVNPTPATPVVPPVPRPPGADPGQNPGVPARPGPPAPSPGGPSPVKPRPAVPLRPAASAGDIGRGVAPAAVSATPATAAARIEDLSPGAAQAGAPAMPMSPAGAGAPPGSAGSGSRPPVTSGTPSTGAGRPATPRRPPARPGPAPRDESSHPAESAVVMPPVPVSAARAERDAVAEAAAPESVRKRDDPLRLARRIAAALNAPGSSARRFMGFFWLTAVTTDGTIVVANSYALAFIPDGVQLPDAVLMVSADEAIPAAERARWATQPLLALQSWAAHHEKTLRAVIATAEQFAGSDPGATKVVLEPDDIPARGDMTGRSRLAVVDPATAELLAQTPDAGLAALLPPAATSGSDQRRQLWFDVMRPVGMGAANAQAEHLKAFQAYAAASRDACRAEVKSDDSADARRSALGEWMYWKHLAALMDSALAPAT